MLDRPDWRARMQVGYKTTAFGVCILHGLVAGLQDLYVALSGELHVSPFVSLLCPAPPCLVPVPIRVALLCYYPW